LPSGLRRLVYDSAPLGVHRGPRPSGLLGLALFLLGRGVVRGFVIVVRGVVRGIDVNWVECRALLSALTSRSHYDCMSEGDEWILVYSLNISASL
jgi:hypothetical protein